MSATFSSCSFVGALLLTLMSPLKSAEGSAGLPLDIAPFPLVVGPFAMIAVPPWLLARKRNRVGSTETNAKEAATSPVPAVQNKGCGEVEEVEEVEEVRSKNESSIPTHACGTNPPELIRAILAGDHHWYAILEEARF